MAKWSAQSVGRILENEIYTGTMVQGKESAPNYKVKKKFKKPKSEWAIVENTHEPIIAKEDFFLVSRIISADTRTAPMQQELYPFAGILKCSECHKSMIRRPVKSNGKTYIYYTCRTNKEDKEKCENSNRISEHQLLACVKEVMKVHIGAISKTDDILSYIETLPREQLQIKKCNQRIEKKREEYTYYQNLIMGLYEDFKRDILNKENYLNMKSIYETIIGEISDSIDVLERDISELLQKKDLTNQWIWEYRKNHNISNLNRSILLSLVREIIVYDKNHIQIHFNYFDEILNKKDNI